MSIKFETSSAGVTREMTTDDTITLLGAFQSIAGWMQDRAGSGLLPDYVQAGYEYAADELMGLADKGREQLAKDAAHLTVMANHYYDAPDDVDLPGECE